HSIELSWMNEENKSRNGPSKRWTRFSVEKMDPKTHTPLYTWYSTHVVEGLESSTSYSFRLRVSRASREGSLSPVLSVFTTREIFLYQSCLHMSFHLMQTCFSGHLDTVKYLHTDGCTPLHWTVITYMIQDSCEVDVMDKGSLWTPLMRVSAISGNAAVTSIILQAGADVYVLDKAGKTPIMVFIIKTIDRKKKHLIHPRECI
uniref:Fibronectin type-III domain-containing protein n=1 Tax=Cyprinus carpio TaxID=7962 RepID=A0A8C1KG58_CYPCA